ncbi:MAG TPA: VWA domain-containing protein [Trueperaceae bacterium]|nr:VWA domain-containing protein [Trueperaceae bacterium]
MTFHWPLLLWLLPLAPLTLALIWSSERRRRRSGGYADAVLMDDVVRRAPWTRTRWIVGLQLAALTLLLVAAARPEASPPLPTNQATTVIALDSSKSMLADDVTPNRFEAARTIAVQFVRDAPRSARLGLVSFSDVASLLVPPTTDHAKLLDALAKVEPGQNTSLTAAVIGGVRLLPGRQGAKMPSALDPASAGRAASQPLPAPRSGAGDPPPGAILVLSDGAGNISTNPQLSQDQALMLAARFATDNHVTIDAVPFGREGGAVTRLNGQDYFVPYSPQNLERLTELSGGSTVDRNDSRAIRQLAHKLGTAIRWVPQKMEITALLSVAAVALLLVAGGLSLSANRRVP